MDQQKLVKMANEIAAFFAADPDANVALDGVAGHLQRFWEPRMRRELVQAIEAGTATGVTPLVADAVRKHRATLLPA